MEVFAYTPHRIARTLHTQHFRAFGSRMHCDAKCVNFKTIVRRSRASFLILTRCGLIFHLFPLLQHTPSLRYPSYSDEQPLDPRTGRRSRRLDIQSPFTFSEQVCPNRRPRATAANSTFVAATSSCMTTQRLQRARTPGYLRPRRELPHVFNVCSDYFAFGQQGY